MQPSWLMHLMSKILPRQLRRSIATTTYGPNCRGGGQSKRRNSHLRNIRNGSARYIETYWAQAKHCGNPRCLKIAQAQRRAKSAAGYQLAPAQCQLERLEMVDGGWRRRWSADEKILKSLQAGRGRRAIPCATASPAAAMATSSHGA